MSEDLKVVIHLKEGQAHIGVQREDTDPLLLRVQVDSLDGALMCVPGAVEQAQAKWAESPRNPAGSMPAPPAPPTPPRATPPRTPAKPKEGQMERMF